MRILSIRAQAFTAALLLSTASTAYAQEAPAAAVAAADAAAFDEAGGIVVTARNREEDINDVPIPITVLSGDTVAQQRVFTIADLTQRAPGLTATTPNADRKSTRLNSSHIQKSRMPSSA